MRRFSPFATLTNVALIGLSLFGCHSDVEPTRIAADCLIKASSTNGVAIAGFYIITYQPAQLLPSAGNKFPTHGTVTGDPDEQPIRWRASKQVVTNKSL